MPKRKAPTKVLKKTCRDQQNGLCGCRAKCGTVLPPDGKGLVQYQHWPALESRPVLEDDSDWIPAQHDPRYLFAEMVACHLRETNEGRSGATTLGSDRHMIAKIKRLTSDKPPRFKRAIPSQPLRSRGTFPKGQKLKSKPFQRRKP
jgi:hypothetical protein